MHITKIYIGVKIKGYNKIHNINTMRVYRRRAPTLSPFYTTSKVCERIKKKDTHCKRFLSMMKGKQIELNDYFVVLGFNE